MRDMHDLWVQVEVRDAAGQLMGVSRPEGDSNENVFVLRATVLDVEGDPEILHQVHRFSAPAGARARGKVALDPCIEQSVTEIGAATAWMWRQAPSRWGRCTPSRDCLPLVRKNTGGASKTGSPYLTTLSHLREKQFTATPIPDKMIWMSKRYQKKSSATKKREKKSHDPSRNAAGPGQTTGVMGNMVHGFRRAVGSEASKGTKGGSLLWAAVLVTAVIAIIAWNFAR
ncbi:MAG: hypothetical protein WCE62_09490 [Polyangiales bacterium]